jgi:hypothetical protein
VRPVEDETLPDDAEVPLFVPVAGRETVAEVLSVALLSLIDGVVLTIDVLFADTLVGAVPDVLPVLPTAVLLTAVLPEAVFLDTVDVVRPEDSFLLTVLLLPIPPLRDDVPEKSLSEPV